MACSTKPATPYLDDGRAAVIEWGCRGRHRRPGHASGWERAARLLSFLSTEINPWLVGDGKKEEDASAGFGISSSRGIRY
jgi:hypothetical protein